MDFMVDIQIKPPKQRITYQDKIFVIGSCFTEHIGGRLAGLKFSVLQNPNGILFDPLSVCRSLCSYIVTKKYNDADLFELNELWQSWQHHSVFSGIGKEQVLQKINKSQHEAHEFLKDADWLIITLGSAFFYQLTASREPVANCHRAPAQWFSKELTGIDDIVTSMADCIRQLLIFNPALKIILTISPVRHIRDGVIENNRSKARLIEAVHFLADRYNDLNYYPSYELVIDVLRDYRFYDIDLVHPNYAATEFVFDKFAAHYLDKDTIETMNEIKSFLTAYKHKPFHSSSQAHLNFMKTYLKKIQHFQQKNPHLDFSKEIDYFKGSEV